MSLDPDFIRAQTVLQAPSLVPEITLYLASEITPLWQMTEEKMGQTNMPPPFWAFAWPGGQGMARYILDHPEEVRGKRVLDLGAGSGLVAIAAAKAGAAHSIASDIDPLAHIAIQMNAARNNVVIENARAIDMKQPADVDIILAGDVCYQQEMSATIIRWLRICAEAGVKVLLADPGRAWVPKEGLEEITRYEVPTLRELEDNDVRTVTLWRVPKTS